MAPRCGPLRLALQGRVRERQPGGSTMDTAWDKAKDVAHDAKNTAKDVAHDAKK
jgi:hypothetical protein